MIVKATKKMAMEIKKALKNDENFMGYSVDFQNLSSSQFAWLVGSCWDNEQDYNINTNTFNTICITYPYNYYANNKYLTSKDLLRVFKTCNKTFDGFINDLKSYIEI